MLYTDVTQETDSLMAWLDRRLEHSSRETFPIYVKSFKRLWQESFGTTDNIPQAYKDKVSAKYESLR